MPGNVAITRRDIGFPLDAVPRLWFGNDCHKTRLFDALSLFFPEGERFFIESVRHYRQQIPAHDPLNDELRAFIGQEALHSREHRAFNDHLHAQGLGSQELEEACRGRLDFVREKASPSTQLAMTLCLEHFTAILADQVLANESLFDGADPTMASLWRWHAMEETEHKAVAFDVYQRVLPRSPRRYIRRCWVMLNVSLYFTLYVWLYLIQLVRRDGRGSDWRGWLRLLGFMFVSPGPFRRIVPQWLAWFRPGFHPWQHDNRERLDRVRREYPAGRVDEAA